MNIEPTSNGFARPGRGIIEIGQVWHLAVTALTRPDCPGPYSGYRVPGRLMAAVDITEGVRFG